MNEARRRPEDFGTSVVRPADFDQFWEAILAEAAAIPLNPSVEHQPLRSTDAIDVYEIHYDSLDGVRVAGWYCRPKPEARITPPYPALVVVPGYIAEPTLPKSWASKGYAAIGVAPRGKLRSNRQFNPGYPGLLMHNVTDRQTYAYRGFYIDACRAVDFALSRPEIDPTRIGVQGSSQGGALSIVVAALRRDVITCGAPGAPYLCGMMDAASLTHSYPYEEVNDYLRHHPDREPLVRATLDYYDGVNFAPLIRCPMRVHIGLEDDVCPPETGYAVYNAMQCPKELHASEGCAHDAGAYWQMPEVEAFLAKHLRPVPVPTPSKQERAVSRGQVVPDADIAAYWDELEQDLARVEPAADLEVLPLRSTEFCTVYAMRLTSIGPYRIFGYYSVPRGDGPFPGLLITPRYGSVNHVPPYADRQRYAVLTLMHRGQRLADQPFAAAYPGLLTLGIDDARSYVYRGIAADCLRGAEFLLSRPEVDTGRVGITGGDLAAITAARRPGFRAMQASGFQFYRVMESRLRTTAYPTEEINDYLRAHPERESDVARSVAMFDPAWHAPRVTAATLLPLGDAAWLEQLESRLAGPVTHYAVTHRGADDHRWMDAWLADQLGVGKGEG